MEVKFTDEESQVLSLVLGQLVIRSRTGDIGIMHGMERFVSSQRSLKKPEREMLDSIARKVSLKRGIATYNG